MARSGTQTAGCLLVLLLAACSNLHPVVHGEVYRSAQPGPAQAREWLRSTGARTLLFLRSGGAGSSSYEISRGAADACGVEFVQVPLSSKRFPDAGRLLEVWEVLDTAERPILLHCLAGADRTGLVAALAVVHATDDVELARRQFALAPYLHTGLRGAWRMPAILDAYARCSEPLAFPDWVRTRYDPAELERTAGRGELRSNQW